MEKFIKQLVRDAGKILLNKFGHVGVSRTKAHPLDVLTQADLLVDKLITSRIRKKFPTHAIISEESGQHNQNSKKWIIDPLDGTSNFAHQLPLFVTQVAFAENDQLKMSAIYDPIHNHLFFAEKGRGAFLNGRRIQVSQLTKLANSRGCIDFALTKENYKLLGKLNRVVNHNYFWLRNLGSSGINGSLVACGGLDWGILKGCHVWDYAPVALLIEEAGGMARTLSGRRWSLKDDDLVIGNKALVAKLLKILP